MTQKSMWAQAAEMAERTPENRNRYVDLLRAVSIGAVVLGHWIMAAPYLEQGHARLAHLLDVSPWTHWLTWVFQVMPVFFFVGGFSNGTSWDGAQAKGEPFPDWLAARMRRLLGPVMPLILLWAALGAAGFYLGVPSGMIRIGSQVSIVPVWFLAIYLLIVMLVPVSRSAWRRWGMWSVWVPIVLAAINDVVFFSGKADGLAWFNYLFVWSAVHQLGYAWQAGKLSGLGRTLPFLVVGAPALWFLTQYGPYPTSLVGVPSDAISNTLPPKLPLLALGAAQIGLLLSLERPMRRWLARKTVWTLTVLINGMIMTVFLWHSTVMMLTTALGFWKFPGVFGLDPGSGAWWAWRPIWVVVFALLTVPFVLIFVQVERVQARRPLSSVSLSQLIVGAALLSAGLALLALRGVGGEGPLGLRWIAVTLPLIGAELAGFGPLRGFLPNPRRSN